MQPLMVMPAGTLIQRFLEHQPSGASLYHKGLALQKIILVFGGSFNAQKKANPIINGQMTEQTFLQNGQLHAKMLNLISN